MRTCTNGKVSLKSESRTDASNMSKKDACAPTPTSSVVIALKHACASCAVDVAMITSVDASRFTNMLLENLSNAFNATSICGMRCPVASNVRPTSGLVEAVTSTMSWSMSCRSFGVGQSVIEDWWGGAWRGMAGRGVAWRGMAGRGMAGRGMAGRGGGRGVAMRDMR